MLPQDSEQGDPYVFFKYKLNIETSAVQLTLNLFNVQPNHPYTHAQVFLVMEPFSEFIVQTASIDFTTTDFLYG